MTHRRIQNFDDLAETKTRRHALEIVEAAYDAIDTDSVIARFVRVENNTLFIKEQSFDLSQFINVYIVGCGKVACEAAAALEKVLGDTVSSGAVIGFHATLPCNTVETYVGTHPLPSKINFKAAERIKEISKNATKNDLVIAIIGGGGSALLCSSDGECDQGQHLYKTFLQSGGSVEELNVVRRHISDLKGGGLAKILYPATVVGLIFSDVPSDDKDIPGDSLAAVASGPTYKDLTTVADAQKIIDKYHLGEFELHETPKEDHYFENVTNIALVTNETATVAMKEKAEELGYTGIILSHDMSGLLDDVAKAFIEGAQPGTVRIAGGEPRLVIPKHCTGKGGRCDMLALTMLEYLTDGQVFVSFASDGTDNSDAAGAIVDGHTQAKVGALSFDLNEHKACLDSYPVLQQAGDLLFTGKIEANVSDLMLLITPQ